MMPASRSAALVALLLAVTALPPTMADGEEAEAPLLTFRYLVDTDLAGPAQRFQAFDTHVMNAFDLNRDGRLEIIAQNDNHHVYVIDAVDGVIRAELHNNLPAGWGARDINGVAIGDVNANGKPDLVVTNAAGTITVLELTGADEDGRFTFEEVWNVTPDPRHFDPDIKEPDGRPFQGYPSADGAAYLADVEGNGTPWAFTQSDDIPGHYAFDATGEMQWGHLNGDGNSGPVVDDLDGDGRLEVVFATDGGRLLAYDALTGEEQWRYHLPKWPGSIPAKPSVVDLDGSGTKTILFGGRHAERDPGDPGKALIGASHAQFAAVEHDGSERWVVSPGWANPLVYDTPRTHDVDGDGVLDVIFIDWNTIGHKPGNWQVTGKANLFAVGGADGDILWRTEVDSVWSNKGTALVDVTANGAPEVLVEEMVNGNGISMFDVLTGERVGWVPFPEGEWVAARGPLAADLRGDGSVVVVIPVVRKALDDAWCDGARLDVGCREGALAVYETRPGAQVFDGNNPTFNHALTGRTELEGGMRFDVPLGGGPADSAEDGAEGNETRFDVGPGAGDHVDDEESDLGAERRLPGPGVVGVLLALAVAGSRLGGRSSRRIPFASEREAGSEREGRDRRGA